jgi:chorismate mutase/prephenate dehydratase
VTRFLIIGQQFADPTEHDKTSIVFSLKNEAGILSDALESFKKYKINLNKIESRPSKQDIWQYYFFIDLEGHFEEPIISKCLGLLKKKCIFFKILGSYPKEVQ